MSRLIDADETRRQIIAFATGLNQTWLSVDTVMMLLAQVTAADVAPVVHGRVVGSLEDGRYRRRFSCCGEDATMITNWAWPKYCPNCGAKIDG